MEDKKRSAGSIYFVDRPIIINNKLLFDGYCFLGERYYYRIRSVHNYLTSGGARRHEDAFCYRSQPMKIKPNHYFNGRWSYSMWGKKQDIGSVSRGFPKDFIKRFKPLFTG